MALAVDAVHVGGEWIRHAPYRSDLLGRATEPTDGRWQRQEIGDTLWREGWAGLVSRSAARPEAFVVCVFAAGWPPAGCVPKRAIQITDVPIPPTGMTT